MTLQLLDAFLAQHEGIVLAALSFYSADSRRVAALSTLGSADLKRLTAMQPEEIPEATRILLAVADNADAAAIALRHLSSTVDDSPQPESVN